MTPILLTGANGFLGKSTLVALRKSQYTIHAVSRTATPGMDAHGTIWHTTNLLSQSQTNALMQLVRPQGLIHLAWNTTHGEYWNSASNLDWLAASVSLLPEFARHGGKRIVIAGSSAEYQWGGLDNLSERDSAIAPASLYGVSKNALREVLEKWASEYRVSWSWGRIFNIFGEWDNPARLVPKTIKALLTGDHLSFDAGTELRDFMHVRDAGEAISELYSSEFQGPINIASGEALSIQETVRKIALYLKAENQLNFDSPNKLFNNPSRIVADVALLRGSLGWKPKSDLDTRLREACDWWRLRLLDTNR